MPVSRIVNGTWTFFHEFSSSCAFGATTCRRAITIMRAARRERSLRSAAVDAELLEPAPARRETLTRECGTEVLAEQPEQRAQHARRHRDPLRRRALLGELAIELGHRDRDARPRLLERALVIELLELDAARELGHLRVEVAAEEAGDDDDHHAPERAPTPRCRA